MVYKSGFFRFCKRFLGTFLYENSLFDEKRRSDKPKGGFWRPFPIRKRFIASSNCDMEY